MPQLLGKHDFAYKCHVTIRRVEVTYFPNLNPVFMTCIKIKVEQTSAVLLRGWLLFSWGSLLGCPRATSPSHLSPVLGGISFGRCLVPEVKATQD